MVPIGWMDCNAKYQSQELLLLPNNMFHSKNQGVFDLEELWLPELSGERDRPRRLVCPSYLGCLVAVPTSTSNLKRLTSVPWRFGGLEGWRGEGNLMSLVVICPLGWWQLEKNTYIN